MFSLKSYVCLLSHLFVVVVFSSPLASREQLRRRQGSAASGEKAGTQTDREVLVWGWSGKRAILLCCHALANACWSKNNTGCINTSWFPQRAAVFVISFHSVRLLFVCRLTLEGAVETLGLASQNISKNTCQFPAPPRLKSSCILFITHRINL